MQDCNLVEKNQKKQKPPKIKAYVFSCCLPELQFYKKIKINMSIDNTANSQLPSG